MTGSILLVYVILALTILLFVSERLRLDVVALMALLALTLTGILTPAEALAGFADPVVIMIAGLFVVGDALFQTGVAEAMGRLPATLAGESQVKLLVVIMILVAILSGFMSSTGTVAVMLPVVMGSTRTRDIPPSKLLIPLSVASLLGGMLTLIGTAPNIVVSNHLVAMGREGFRFFSFAPVGVPVVVVGITFMALVGRKLLPERPSPGTPPRPEDAISKEDLLGSWELKTSLFRMRIPADSPLVGKSLAELDLPDSVGLTVLEMHSEEAEERGRRRPLRGRRFRDHEDVGRRAVLPDTRLREGDTILLQGSADGAARLVGRGHALLLIDDPTGEHTDGRSGIAEVLLTPRSRLLGRTLMEIRFRDRYGLTVCGIQRMGRAVEGDVREAKLRFGDMLLVEGPWERIRMLGAETRDFVVAMTPSEVGPALRPLDRTPLAIGIMCA